jgi:2-polyprenyl-3-methyl-5-hydroxy-6-metoxy-1,4-benzoquinol methylase
MMKPITPQALQKYLGKMLNDMGAAASGALIVVGDRLGLFRAVAAQGPRGASAEAVAAKAGNLDPRYVREWLSCMAASGYVEYAPDTDLFAMKPEQVTVFADPDSPVALAGGYYSVASLYLDEPRVSNAFRTGAGIEWGDRHSCLFCGTERFYGPGYAAHLVQEWIPALGDVGDRLRSGARVADVGCGHGCSTTILARAFPDSDFVGYDLHAPSIERAQETARELSLPNVRFEVATAKDYPGHDYDLVTFFDCLHDMGDPAGAAAHVRRTLQKDGTWMIVEPLAGNTLAENLNPVGRLYYAFSTMVCTPASRSQEVGLALGAQAGEARLREVVCKGGGFTRFRRATETPFNLILEARH